MSEASAKHRKVSDAAAPAPPPQPPENGIVAWLQIWRQVLIAEVLSVMEHRRCD